MDKLLLSQSTHMLARMLHLSGQAGLRLQMELLKTSARGPKAYISVVFGIAAACLALTWVPWQWALGWYIAVTLVPMLQMALRRRFVWNISEVRQVPRVTLAAIAIEMPLHILWLFYIPMCWVSGDMSNNAYLIIFMLGSVTISSKLYGPCYMLALPVLILYCPFVVYYTLSFGVVLADIMLPVMQLAFLLLLAVLSFQHFQHFCESTRRRFTIERLVKNIAAARDDAERANRAKSAFLASMSHELRTPLNAIIGFSDMMRQEIMGPVSPPKYQDYAEDIYSSGQHLLGLINDVLDLSKVEAGKRELEDSEILLEDIIRQQVSFITPAAEQDNIHISISVPPGMILVADARAVRQILLNFLSNAVKFSPTGGEIGVFARKTPSGRLILGVRDHGVGMDASGIKKALEPYGQVRMTTPKHLCGTGLGLPIARALIEAHGAAFHIDSAIGRGTLVWADFPPFRVKSAQDAVRNPEKSSRAS